jgi:hypothetical protein
LRAGFIIIHQGIISINKGVNKIRHHIQYLKRSLVDVVVRNALAPNADKSDNTKDSFYEELERVFARFTKISIQK